MKKYLIILLAAFFHVYSIYAQILPIALDAQNPHYFSYKGKPTILVTSGEHYGALVNLDFDYTIYFEELSSKNLNLTRVFTGFYVEPQGAFNIASNTLAPKPNSFICPWPRSAEPGYANGGNKFDLSKWDVRYFERLKDLASAAKEKGIIIELALFCPFYEQVQWEVSPINSKNNINGWGNTHKDSVYSLEKTNGLLNVQEAMVRKIVEELKLYDNIIYEICNEPYAGVISMAWQHHIADLIIDAEKPFAHKHLISQNINNGSQKIIAPHPGVSVFNFHYASPPVAVAENYRLNKVIGDNETGFSGVADSTYRREGWEFILSGGALYNNLDYSFTSDHERGTYRYPSKQPGGGTTELRKQLQHLLKFMNQFDFVLMHPDSLLVSGGLPDKGRATALVLPGKQYAVYISGGPKASLEMEMPAGHYKIEWMNTLSGKTEKREYLKHGGGKAVIQSPAYNADIALAIFIQ